MRVSCAVDGRLAREGEIDLFCCICSACAHMHAWDRIRKIEEQIDMVNISSSIARSSLFLRRCSSIHPSFTVVAHSITSRRRRQPPLVYSSIPNVTHI
jgi:maleate cis-trans isomerase